MNKQAITEEMEIHKEWYKQARKMTAEKLPEFINHLINDYEHDYGTICHAITAGGLAAIWAIENSPQGGITGFQAGCIMWKFIRNWNYDHNKTGLKLMDYDNFLYPQYHDKLQKTISSDIWTNIQKEARENLEKRDNPVSDRVVEHWKSIVDGNVPFGYTVLDDN